MSKLHQHGKDVPTSTLANRLRELSAAVANGYTSGPEFYLNSPAEFDRDADLVLAEAARRLVQFSNAGSEAQRLDEAFDSFSVEVAQLVASVNALSQSVTKKVKACKCATGGCV